MHYDDDEEGEGESGDEFYRPKMRWQYREGDLSLNWGERVYVAVWRWWKWNLGERKHQIAYRVEWQVVVRRKGGGRFDRKRWLDEEESRGLFLLMKRVHQWMGVDREAQSERARAGEVKPWNEPRGVRAVDVSLVGKSVEEAELEEIVAAVSRSEEVELKDED